MKKPKRKRPTDLNKLAASIVEAATEGEPEPTEEDDGKKPHAVALGRLGGKARASKLTKEERSAIARKAAKARWSNKS